jgi:REP element-mobilizing transposase RayT
MPRKRRIHYPGAIYHVMLRGNAKQDIFYRDEEYRYFETILAEGLEQHSLKLHAYCWMKNHVHMALQVKDRPLSKLMQNLSQRYTQWFNKKHDRVGHLFQGRYKAILVDKDAYLSELIRYIHLNPVRAEIVIDPVNYRFSSHAAYAGHVQAPSWLFVDRSLGYFGKTLSGARVAYLYFMGQAAEEELMEQLRHGSSEGRILGNEIFVKEVLKENREEIPAEITIEQVVDAGALVYQVSPGEMTSASRSRHLAEARAMTAIIGLDHCHYLLSDFAVYFNRGMPCMSRQVKAIRDQVAKKPPMQEKMQRIKNQISTIRQA